MTKLVKQESRGVQQTGEFNPNYKGWVGLNWMLG